MWFIYAYACMFEFYINLFSKCNGSTRTLVLHFVHEIHVFDYYIYRYIFARPGFSVPKPFHFICLHSMLKVEKKQHFFFLSRFFVSYFFFVCWLVITKFMNILYTHIRRPNFRYGVPLVLLLLLLILYCSTERPI